jgi:lipid-A-disaccharide synthase
VSFVFRHFFGVPYISLVNLIAGREVVRELFGATFSPPTLRTELLSLLDAPAASRPPAASPDGASASRPAPPDTSASRRTSVLAGYAEVRRRLGPVGAARRLAARLATLR